MNYNNTFGKGMTMRILLLIYVFFLSACTTSSVAETHQDSLYETFQEFRSLVVEDYALATEAMISDKYVARTRQAQENMPQELRSPYFESLAKKYRPNTVTLKNGHF